MAAIPPANGSSLWQWPSLQSTQQHMSRFVPCIAQVSPPYALAAGAVAILAIGGIITAIAYYILRTPKGKDAPPQDRASSTAPNAQNPAPTKVNPKTRSIVENVEEDVENVEEDVAKWISKDKERFSKIAPTLVKKYETLEKLIFQNPLIEEAKKYKGKYPIGRLLIIFSKDCLALEKSAFAALINEVPKLGNTEFKFSGSDFIYKKAFLNHFNTSELFFSPKELVEKVTCSLKNGVLKTLPQAEIKALLGTQQVVSADLDFSEFSEETFEFAYKTLIGLIHYSEKRIPVLHFRADQYIEFQCFLKAHSKWLESSGSDYYPLPANYYYPGSSTPHPQSNKPINIAWNPENLPPEQFKQRMLFLLELLQSAPSINIVETETKTQENPQVPPPNSKQFTRDEFKSLIEGL